MFFWFWSGYARKQKLSTSTLDNVPDSPIIDIHGIHKYFWLLLKKILDGRAPVYRSEKLLSLKYHKSHDTRSRLPYRLSIPRTNSMKRMFVYNTVKLWINVSENALVRSSNVRKFKRNLFDSVMCKFTPDSFKIDFLKQLNIFLKFLSMCKFE